MREIAPGVFEHGTESRPMPDTSMAAAVFLARLTVDEEAAISRASADTPVGNPAARLAQAKHRVRLRRLNAKQSVRLDDIEVVEFLSAAQSEGVLTPERVREILS